MTLVHLQRRLSVRFGELSPVTISILALLLGVVIAVQCGAVPVAGQDWIALPGTQNYGGSGSYVLWTIRLPRALFAILIGASLGMSGALSQGLFRNPLSDSGLLGISAGAACAVALSLVFFSSSPTTISAEWRNWLVPGVAFFGALSVCFILDRIARWITPGSIAGLLLTGVALNALAGAIIGLCTYLANDEQLRSLSFWTLGSLASANWSLVTTLLILILVAWRRSQQLANGMNALALGEAAANHVGIDVQGLRKHIIFLVAILAGFSVAWCGMIGFVGLLAPHLVRTWVGSDQRQVIPYSMLAGGLLLLLADTLARTVAIPAEIPVGIFTALLGGPFFLMQLRTMRRQLG
ncbi:FecCD family ABC transporter permease [Undibacterium sp. SXout11W]|uniref:FecCD family ABC transporter permease n=1 Tax=Undibacterium sp. SXout11W TaxID=3413050 RepID=UPI003BF3ED2F